VIEFPSQLGVETAIPPTCFGSYQNRLLISSCWPLVLLVAVLVALIFRELVRDIGYPQLIRRGKCDAALVGLQSSLPMTLVVTFLLVPSTATRLFKTFLCDPIEHDATAKITRRYLHDDLTMSCDSPEYEATKTTALVLIAVWPLGVPVLYFLLLCASREALVDGIPTPLSRMTAFLSADYKATAWWWEPVEMCRKLFITGWVMLIEESFEQARVVAALLVSISFQALHLSVMPLKRPEDSTLMHVVELTLIFVYVAILLIKACDMSSVKVASADLAAVASAVCSTYGFGSSPAGLFLFFVFFGLSMLSLQLIIACSRLWVEGRLLEGHTLCDIACACASARV